VAVGGSKEDIKRKFNEIVGPQIHPAIANTLTDFLLAAPGGQHEASESAVTWTLGRLWVDAIDPREGSS
jgi:hypothetical protein